MKKLVAMFLFIAFVFSFSLSAFASFNVLIDDSAELFAPDEIESIDSAAYELASAKDFSVAVITTDNAMGKSAMEYADDYYDNLIFNSGWSENGIAFLIDMDNREIYISCAGLCIDEYSEYELNMIIDSGYSYIVDGEYGKSIVEMIYNAEKIALSHDENSYSENDEFVPAYGDDYNYNDGYYYDDNYYSDNSSVNNGFEISHVFVYIIIGLVAGVITVIAVKSNYKNTGKGDEFNADDIHLELTASNDNVISKNVITTRIPRNNNRSGGGGGSRSSSHRSSGGVRHSGAGRKF